MTHEIMKAMPLYSMAQDVLHCTNRPVSLDLPRERRSVIRMLLIEDWDYGLW